MYYRQCSCLDARQGPLGARHQNTKFDHLGELRLVLTRTRPRGKCRSDSSMVTGLILNGTAACCIVGAVSYP
jgi:hypothetical protein